MGAGGQRQAVGCGLDGLREVRTRVPDPAFDLQGLGQKLLGDSGVLILHPQLRDSSRGCHRPCTSGTLAVLMDAWWRDQAYLLLG